MNNIRPEAFTELLLAGTPIIDVRAPVEFLLGKIPGSFNFPLLNDEERAVVGTVYKNEGQAAAITQGHTFVGGETRAQRTQEWLAFIAENPTAVITCFRGGLRSQTVQAWLKEKGIERPLIEGGYKAVRQFLLTEQQRQLAAREMIVISGPTGSGKTEFLNRFANDAVDLEDCANHRGSAFGAMPGGQPAQIDFENQISLRLMRLHPTNTFLVEDESRMIGKLVMPLEFHGRMNEASCVRLESSLPERVERIFRDYVEIPLSRPDATDEVFLIYASALFNIQKKLGGVLYAELKQLLESCRQDFLNRTGVENNRQWIEKLLVHYYDPVYERGFSRRQSPLILRAGHDEAEDFLRKYLHQT